MAIIKPKCSLWGKKFSPKKLLVIPNIIIKHSNEPEDYNSKNSATTYNYGACYIETPREIKNHLRIEWMLDYILEHREKILNILVDIKTDIGSLKKDVGFLKDDVASLKDDVSFLRDDVAILKDDVAVLKDDVAVLKDDMAALKGDVSVLKNDMSGVK